MNHFVSVLLIATALALTVFFGVAAWRLTEDKSVDITGEISRQSYGWKAMPSR